MKQYKITVNGTTYDVQVEEDTQGAPAAAPAAAPTAAPAAPATAPKPAPTAPVAAMGQTEVKSPIPGNILDIKVKTGDQVKAGEVLCVLEAMKMENDITAPQDGTVANVAVAVGNSVDTGDLLFLLA